MSIVRIHYFKFIFPQTFVYSRNRNRMPISLANGNILHSHRSILRNNRCHDLTISRYLTFRLLYFVCIIINIASLRLNLYILIFLDS